MTSQDQITEIKSDRAGEEYWTQFWKNFKLPPPINIHSSNVNEYPNRLMHKLFKKAFKGLDTTDKKILEIGCGNSVFLTYFKKEFNFDIYGLDYSELGCKQTEKIFERDKVKGSVIHADAFKPPEDFLEKFDVVCSFGVVEHFEDTASTLKAFAKFLKPGGILISTLPNFKGATGTLHKFLNKPVYDVHVPLGTDEMRDAIQKAGLKEEVNEYFLALSFAITLEGIDGKKIPYFKIKKILVKTIRYASKIIWILENFIGTMPAGKRFAGGIFTSARKL
ncbi:MAG: class I SAM-dependent methyltransferase [Saprospiraceae bacterium]|nr:class I SAM-dependent methyltransferase [Saprospiraceae bacterium]MBP6523491.1 class I SAM-dependent methyltransferase [Saprospiraceae bacterium]